MALTTGAFLSDSGNPLDANGDNGDHYRNTINQDLWFKVGGSWTLVGNVNDATPDGIGTIWLHGSGVPLNANGENGNYYRNTTNQDIWFKVGGFWTLIFGTTSMTSATSGVRSINGIQPDAGGDVTLLIEDLGGSTDLPATTISRGQKFGNHSNIMGSTPEVGPYLGRSSVGSNATMQLATVSLVEAMTNRGNVADFVIWEMSSNTINIATQVALYAIRFNTIYPQQQWRTGAKMQFLASLALSNAIPTTEDFEYRIGLANGSNEDHRSADPWAGAASGAGNEHTGCAAMFIANNTSIYWQCKSGRKTDTETTITTIPVVLGNFDVFHVCVTATGAVEFRINGTLVATHSGTGIIPDGAYLNEGVAVRNIAATTTAKKGFYLDEFQFRLALPSARTGFAFT